MPLQAVLFDRKKLIEHGSWNEPLKELLLGLYPYGVLVIDVSSTLAAEGKLQIADMATEAEKKLLADNLTERKLTFLDCLMIADCEDTIQKAKEWNVAVLGYQPSGTEGIITSPLDMLVEGFEEVDFYFLERMYQRFHHLPWTVVETERCFLREITLEDIDKLYEIYSPEEITCYLDDLHEERQQEEAYTKAYIENMYRFYGYGLWVVIEKATGELIGRAGLEHVEVEEEVCLQLGYVIAKHKQRQGYATEVCQGIIAYAKEALGAEKLYCLIQKENVNSICLAEKLDFHFEKSVNFNGKAMQRYLKILQT